MAFSVLWPSREMQTRTDADTDHFTSRTNKQGRVTILK